MKNILFGKYIFRMFLVFLICYLFICDNLWGLSLEGKILTIDMQSHFLVLNVGEKDNVFKGKKFNVFKGNKLLGVTEVLQTKKNVAAFDTELLGGSVLLAPKDVLILKEIDSLGTTKLPGITVKSGDIDINVSKKDRKDINVSGGRKKEVYTKRKTPLVARPFKKVKDWTVGAGKNVKSWFETETENYKDIEGVGSRTSEDGILDIPDMRSGVKLETAMMGGRRKILFMINEELKNRGFIVTNYSVIEGMIHAQKSLKLSTYEAIFANIKSAIDHKVIYFITVEKLDETSSHILLNISVTYKKGNEYNDVEIKRNSNLVDEAKEILVEVKNKI